MGSIAITGKPSGGKSIYAVREVLRVLEEDTRPIVTNLALKLDDIVAYFLKKGREDIDVYKRVRLLTYEETGAFWRYRGGPNARYLGPARTNEDAKEWAANVEKEGKEGFPDGIVLPAAPPNKDYGAEWLNTVLEAACPLGGVVYFIDEMHEHLNARNWQRHGLVCSDYIAIHAHLGDDFYWITQAPSLVDSAFKVRTQEFIYCSNGAKELLFGKFNRAGQRQFTANSYLEIYTGTQHSQWDKSFPLDLDIAACYKRSRFGGAGDTAEKKKGLHLYWMWVCAALVVVGAIFVTVILPQWAGKKLFGTPAKKELAKVDSLVPVPQRVAPVSVPAGPSLRVEGCAQVGGMLCVSAGGSLFQAGGMYQGRPILRVLHDRAILGSGSDLEVVRFDWSGAVGYPVTRRERDEKSMKGMEDRESNPRRQLSQI